MTKLTATMHEALIDIHVGQAYEVPPDTIRRLVALGLAWKAIHVGDFVDYALTREGRLAMEGNP